MRRRFALALVLAACSPDVVDWGAVQLIGVRTAPGSSLALEAQGEPLIRAPMASDSVPVGAAACPGSVVVADDGAGGAFAAWWAIAGDRRVVLLVARRERQGARLWRAPVVADDRDRGRRECDRPRPAIAADGVRGHVHLAYFLEPADGPGVYAGHSMEDGAYFHGPIVVVYGDRPARTAVDVEGDLVVVAHEDPNSVRPRIAVAISETAGHLIEHRFTVPTGRSAMAPLVAVSGRRVAVAWAVPDSPSSGIQARVGTLSERVNRSGGGTHE